MPYPSAEYIGRRRSSTTLVADPFSFAAYFQKQGKEAVAFTLRATLRRRDRRVDKRRHQRAPKRRALIEMLCDCDQRAARTAARVRLTFNVYGRPPRTSIWRA